MEHFDEYLDDYLSTVVAGQFIPEYLGPKPPDDRGPVRFFRAFFTTTGEFELLGKVFQIQPLVDEIGRLHNTLTRFNKEGSRLTEPSLKPTWSIDRTTRLDSAVKIREIIKLIEEDGWYLDRTRGSHRQYKHASKAGLVTIPGKPGDDLAPGTQNSILKQARLK